MNAPARPEVRRGSLAIAAPAAALPATEGEGLPKALSGERLEATGRAGRLSFYVAGDGPPLLLLHSINAAASAYEVRPVFEAIRASRRVYTPDLPGFGFSDRSERDYSVALYVDAIADMLDVIAEDGGARGRRPGPIDALALSLSSEFLARAATLTPERFRTLTLVTPTGFDRGSGKRRASEGGDREIPTREIPSREIPGLRRTLGFPLWGKGIYDLLVAKRSIRFFLEKTFGSKRIDEGLLDYDYRTAHRPGARHAPYAFVSGRLFSGDIRSVYEALRLPVFLAHGTRGDFKDFSEAGWAAARPNWTVRSYDTGALVYFERPAEFLAAFERFLEAPRGASGPRSQRGEDHPAGSASGSPGPSRP